MPQPNPREYDLYVCPAGWILFQQHRVTSVAYEEDTNKGYFFNTLVVLEHAISYLAPKVHPGNLKVHISNPYLCWWLQNRKAAALPPEIWGRIEHIWALINDVRQKYSLSFVFWDGLYAYVRPVGPGDMSVYDWTCTLDHEELRARLDTRIARRVDLIYPNQIEAAARCYRRILRGHCIEELVSMEDELWKETRR